MADMDPVTALLDLADFSESGRVENTTQWFTDRLRHIAHEIDKKRGDVLGEMEATVVERQRGKPHKGKVLVIVSETTYEGEIRPGTTIPVSVVQARNTDSG